MKISPNETLITGRWIEHKGQLVGDDTCKRINELIRNYLHEIGRDPSGWDALYRDPQDARLWELIYPESELHGGGPPQLRCLTYGEAEEKYGLAITKSLRPPP
ncbi:Imm27 family immunity protein [Luteimonas salinilitoris]|uniref:Imm27 family immunity protein n=1 Tax=Luteimonas salinilitoris TaxID=3237697 RepID=A0ABV4HSF4_9GAMM